MRNKKMPRVSRNLAPKFRAPMHKVTQVFKDKTKYSRNIKHRTKYDKVLKTKQKAFVL